MTVWGVSTVGERFWQKVGKGPPSACWEWRGALARRTGYGVFALNGRTRPAHRVAWLLTWGPIPSKINIHHLCENRSCVNPDHLAALSPRGHSMQHEKPGNLNSRKTHCIRGHDLAKFAYVRPNGQRECRPCKALWTRLRRAENPEQVCQHERNLSNAWRAKNRERYNQRMREWQRKKRGTGLHQQTDASGPSDGLRPSQRLP